MNYLNTYTFRSGVPDDVPHVMRMIRARMAWMDSRGMRHWNVHEYDKLFDESYFRAVAAQSELHIAMLGENPVGAVVLPETDDRWPDGATASALYIHNLVADVGAPGAGAALVAYSERIAREQGKAWLRLDYQQGNEPLDDYYGRMGFVWTGQSWQMDDYVGILCRKKL